MAGRIPISEQVASALHGECIMQVPEPTSGQKWRYIAAIREALDQSPSDRKVTERAALMLGNLGGDEATSILTGLLDHAEASVRSAALTGLRSIGDPGNASLAASCLDDPVPAVRKEAIKTLAKFGDPACQSALLSHAERETETYLTDMARQADRAIAARTEPSENGEST